jgi:acyl carrier protein
MLASRLKLYYTWPQGTLAESETQAQRMNTFDEVKTIVSQALQLGNRSATLDVASPLLGAIPELDSMAVVNVITALEEHFGFYVDDDEISADTFDTLGSLVDFVSQKLSG